MGNFVAQKIREKRKENHMTQDELSKKAYLHRNSIINFETGKVSSRIKDLQNIANALNVPLEELIKS